MSPARRINTSGARGAAANRPHARDSLSCVYRDIPRELRVTMFCTHLAKQERDGIFHGPGVIYEVPIFFIVPVFEGLLALE